MSRRCDKRLTLRITMSLYTTRTPYSTYFIGEMLFDCRLWSSDSWLWRLLSPSSLLLLLSLSLLSSFDLSLDFDVCVSFLSSSFSNSCRRRVKTSQQCQMYFTTSLAFKSAHLHLSLQIPPQGGAVWPMSDQFTIFYIVPPTVMG